MVKRKIQNILSNEYVFSVIAKVFGIILGVVYSVLLNRYFGPSLKGSYAIVTNYVSLFSVIMSLGIYQAYPRYRKDQSNIYEIFLGNIKSLFCIYIVIATFLFFILNMNLSLKIAILITPLAVLVKELNYVVLIENPKLRNKASMILNIIDVILVFLFVMFLKISFMIMITFVIIKETITTIIAIQNLKINVFKLPFRIRELIPYIRYGIIPMISTVLMTINYRIDVLMLEHYVTTKQIGIYSVGVTLAEYVWLIPDSLKDILVSKLSKGKTADEVCKIIRVSLFFCIISIIFVVLFGKYVIILLYGEQFKGAYSIMVLLLIGVVGMIFYKMVYGYNVVNGYRYINLFILGLAAISNVIGNLIFIPRYGIKGAALTSIISYLLCGLLYLLWFYIKTKTPIKEIILIKKSDIEKIIKI